jgi:uncharacterized membrane protein YfcA
MTIEQALLLIGASAIAGAMNSVAGGGTMLTFPALLAAGQLSTVANATSTVALWPGQISSLWALRDEIKHNASSIVPLSIIGLAGGIAGAQLLVYTPASLFDRIVPFLILMATALFMAQEPLAKWQKARTERILAPVGMAPENMEEEAEAAVADTPVAPAHPIPEQPEAPLRITVGIGIFLLLVALYGGYFGAGIGILSLAALGLMGMTNIHQMNAIKAIFTIGINGIAAALFIIKGLVDWKIAGMMALGSLFGGYAGAGIARKVGQKNVRRIVIAIGLILAVTQFVKTFVKG